MKHSNEGKQEVGAIGMMTLATTQLIDLMKDGEPGDRITYEDMQKLTGKTFGTGGNGNGNLCTARRRCIGDYGIVWEVERDTRSIICCTPAQIRGRAKSDVRSINRKSKRALKKLGTVKLSDLTSETARGEHLHEISRHGSIAVMSSEKISKQLEARDITTAITPAKLLELWKD